MNATTLDAADAPLGRHKPTRNVFETTDAEAGRVFMNAAYGSHLRMRGVKDGRPLRHSRYELGPVSVDDVTLSMETAYDADPLERLAVVEPLAGWVEHESAGVSEQTGPHDLAIIAPPDLPFSAHTYNLDFSSVVLDMPLLARVAGTEEDGSSGPLRFISKRPRSAASAAQWRSDVRYVREILSTSFEALNEPIVLGDAARLLAASALETFPNTAAQEPTSKDRTDATPATVHRAVAFIEQNAHTDFGLTEVAAAVSVTSRALQYAFLRYHGMSLYGYLRRVRLERAHFDLLAADPTSGETGSEIAARWGFARPGRFSAQYRDTFGVSPDETLAL